MFFKRTTTLFDTQLDQLARKVVEAAEGVAEMIQHPDQAEARARAIGDLEHGADRIVRETVKLQSATLGTVERTDLLDLLERVDDIVDVADSLAERLWLHQVGPATEDARALCEVFVQSARATRRLIEKLRVMQGPQDVLEVCVELDSLEMRGDDLYRTAMLALFSGRHDAMHVVRWKDVYERFERGTNKCADVARLVQGLVQAIA
jgi:uncharacterized protein Yka (UPF0111/DUF47 family)